MKNILIALMVIFTSCGSNKERGENNEEFEARIPGKLHGNYLVSELKNENLGGEDIIFRFDSIKSEVTGNAGCNRLNSVYVHIDSSINFQPAISTKMYCEGKMEREKEIIEILPEISEIIQQNEDVLLLSAESELLLKLKKTNRSE
ncbi:MAG TPA: META domain-containing protein [Gillisia sp.]|nr:META domain-containing protein [Gillisia sp.]